MGDFKAQKKGLNTFETVLNFLFQLEDISLKMAHDRDFNVDKQMMLTLFPF